MTLTGRTGTLVVVALVLSLCVNFLFAGLVLGHRFQGPPGRGGLSGGPFGGGPFFGGPMRELPEEARSVVKEALRRNKPEFELRREAVDHARRQIADILQAETVDMDRLNAALADLLRKTEALHQLGHQVMVEVALQLPPELRRDWARKWSEDGPMARP